MVGVVVINPHPCGFWALGGVWLYQTPPKAVETVPSMLPLGKLSGTIFRIFPINKQRSY